MRWHLATLTYQVPAELVEAVGRAVNEVLSEQDGSAIAAVTVKDQLANAVGVEPLSSSHSPDLSLVQASAAEDRSLALAATNQPETATISSSLNTFSGIGSARETSAMLHPGVVDGPTASLAGRDSGDSVERHALKSPSAATVPPRAPNAGEVFPSGLASTNLAGRDSGNPDSAILTAPAELSPAIAARQAGPNQPKIQKDEEDRAATISQRERKPLKPHCLRPEMCGGYGRKHCGPCERAAGAQAA